jgi:hypothetical protein
MTGDRLAITEKTLRTSRGQGTIASCHFLQISQF